MTTITWPATLPQKPNQQGYTETAGDNMIVSKTDVGPEKRRRRFTVDKTKYSMTMRVNNDQRQTLKDFYRDDLKSGVLAFNFPDPSGDGDIVVRFEKNSPPSFRSTGPGLYRASLTLVEQP